MDQWRDAVQKQYLPEVGDRVKARTIATPLLTQEISHGTYHLAPALSPDGSLIAYFSEKDFYFVDLYLADGETGKPIRLAQVDVQLELRDLPLPDLVLVVVAGRQVPGLRRQGDGKDDIVVVDVRRNKEVRRIKVPLSGITPPVEPRRPAAGLLGQNGGISDLFTVNVDGTDLHQLTNDRYADLMPVWSPDGQTIAYVTDEGPNTDFDRLVWGNFRVAFFDLATGRRDMPARWQSAGT